MKNINTFMINICVFTILKYFNTDGFIFGWRYVDTEDIIRNFMFHSKKNYEIEEMFKERFPIHFDKMERKKGCYIRGYYALTICTAYCIKWKKQPCE